MRRRNYLGLSVCIRSFTDLRFCIRQIRDENCEYNEAVRYLYIDFKKACDSIRLAVFKISYSLVSP